MRHSWGGHFWPPPAFQPVSGAADVPAFQECAEFGRKHGVTIGLQHHDDFLKTADSRRAFRPAKIGY
jgi:hypothetical protein